MYILFLVVTTCLGSLISFSKAVLKVPDTTKVV
jgi:hypothetical protein